MQGEPTQRWFPNWIFPTLILVLVVLFVFGYSRCPSCLDTLYTDIAVDEKSKAWHMMAYSALLCGFLGIMVQMKFASKWMREKFITGPKGIEAFEGVSSSKVIKDISRDINRIVESFASLMWQTLPCMFFYLIFLTLFPNRDVNFCERIAVILLSVFPAFIMIHGNFNIHFRTRAGRKDIETLRKYGVDLNKILGKHTQVPPQKKLDDEP